MRNFRELQVWVKAHKLTLAVYKVTSSFPRDGLFGLTSQTRRAASSIPANIAEGRGRGSNAELARFLQVASGSASELKYHVFLAHDLGFIAKNDYEMLAHEVVEIRRMLIVFIQRLNAYKQ